MEPLSITLSIISLIIAIWAFYESRQANRFNERSIKADKLDKYGKELREIEDSIRPQLEQLGSFAFRAYTAIGKHLDRYSQQQPLRHVLFNFYNNIWDAHKVNILSNRICLKNLLESIYRIDCSDDLKEYDRAMRAYEYIDQLIPPDKRNKTFYDIFEMTSEYRNEFQNVKESLQKQVEKLDSLFKENEYEEFKLLESDIGKRIARAKTIYECSLELGLEDIEGCLEDSRQMPVDWEFHEMLYVVTALYMADQILRELREHEF